MASLDTVRLARLATALSDSKTSLAAKGVSVPAGALLDDIPALIAQVPSGGAVLPTAQPKDVNFMDYDGTIRYSYTLSEAAALTALPEGPAHNGLTFQGWNWTLEEVKALTYPMNVGAIYSSSDNKTHIQLALMDVNLLSPELTIVVNGTVTLDWGDGSAPETYTERMTLTGAGIKRTHTYNAPGIYDITIDTEDGYWHSRYATEPLFSGIYQRFIRRVVADIKNSTTYSFLGAFGNNSACYILIPEANQFYDGSRWIRTHGQSLRSIHIPPTVSVLKNNMATGPALQFVTIPASVTTIDINMFQNCKSLTVITLPTAITSIGNSAFQACELLTGMRMPSALQSIGSNAFNSCKGMRVYDFTHCTAVPTLAAANAFSNIPTDCKIIVPDSLAAEWKEATNWATYADNIISETEANT